MTRRFGLGSFIKITGLQYPALSLAGAFVAGVVVWGGFNWSLEVTNTEAFCLSCHAMRAFVFEEYRQSTHYANRTGVRASCPDCHVPRAWGHKVIRKIGATNELYHWLRGSIATAEKFEAKRGQLARHVWRRMEATDSRECRDCHGTESMVASAQAPAAAAMHALAVDWGSTCIACHQGIAHNLPADFDPEQVMDTIHDRMAADGVTCQPCHPDIARPPADDDWD